ncbi:uncharacterized protein LOC113139216 [Mastacembelus armatus]|uniref:uncharacterized protein LOC113139216 n=1 Tax=Mastacembelus armatus TaxID=205130 RepID=UPI000E46022A|nr:uncharacterized protein LOC113139216 [Mastacembelus armatus]
MMAGHTLRLLILCSLLILTEPFEVREDEWEELGPDIAALHRLTGLSQHMSHRSLQGPTEQRDTSTHGVRVQRSSSRVDVDQNPMSLQDELQDCENFTACVIRTEQELDKFLAAIDEQKTDDWLLSAAEISHSYSQKLLVITDREKSTSDRVQQEYSLDPHYSVIVSKECLYNESCVPETDHYTVVKIFGTVSDDGQTVSGLSGPALAELMLNSALEVPPVFSLDGRTTTDFQRNFIQALMFRCSKAVLETLQENHLIYQVMDQPDAVSRYRIPQRPVDHTTQYDHQHILIMENDPVVRKAATSLYEKHRSTSAVYILDENHSPKRIRGDSVPLSEDSRLVLVGHGARDSSEEMRLSGYRAEDVATIIQQTSRYDNKIKTTSVVACVVGSDEAFVKTLTRKLHDSAHIETELHLRDTLIQVTHSGQKITQEISPDGLQWRHKDDSKKVVATVDRNGDVIIRKEQGSKGEAVFTNERNFLMGNSGKKKHGKDKHVKSNPYGWPDEPRRFVNPDIFKNIDQNNIEAVEHAYNELEALTWGIFHSDRPAPEKIQLDPNRINEKHYVIEIYHKLNWIPDKTIKDILPKCYEIKSGEDITNVIRHYAKTGEQNPTYLMVNDWIYAVNPRNLYVYLVGKRLDNNERENPAKQQEVEKAIKDQFGKEKYSDMQRQIVPENAQQPTEYQNKYVQYVRDTFSGNEIPKSTPSKEAWFTTYLTASVISESARNFRTLPLILMGLDMVTSENNIRTEGLKFFFEEHPMARGGSWTDTSCRGFTGSATSEGSSKSQSEKKINEVITREYKMFEMWKQSLTNNVPDQMAEMAQRYKIFGGTQNTEENKFLNSYSTFKEKTEQLPLTTSEGKKIPSTSGTLGGFDDGHVTMKDLTSASAWERTFKLESYFSRTSASFAEQIHGQLKEKYGVNLHLKEGSARIENGQFICDLVSDAADSKAVEARVDLSPESQRYNQKMLQNIEKAVHDLEHHSPVSSHPHNKYLEHTGTAVGAVGLMLGLKGTVRAFEQGDIEHGVMGTLQTAHGVTAMTTAVVAKQALSSEMRLARAAASVIRSPAMKRTMVVIPIVGIGFGIYNIVDDLKRHDTLGYIDASLDGLMVVLDVIEIVQPELAPFIAPVNLALSVVRLLIDDVYMGIQEELNKLPKDAGVLDKLAAGFVGLDKGLLHFVINVANFFYYYPYEEIEQGRKLIEQISDYHKYYKVTKQQDGTSVIDFTSGNYSWNGGGIDFCLADQGLSLFCMENFVSADGSSGRKCWPIDTQGSNDVILGLGESHQLEYTTRKITTVLFIPVGSVQVVSGSKADSSSRYGSYRGNRNSNRFIAVQKAEDKHMMEVMLSYYYRLYGEPGNDMFFLGPQRSYVEGSGGQDSYFIPENGGKTVINNYDPSKAQDTLHFSVDYSHISVSKSGDHVVLMYGDTHTVTIWNWFLSEVYRHMNMVSGDGVFFEISSTVVSSVQLVARAVNKNFMKQGQTVDTSEPLLHTVTTICGSEYDDVLIGNKENNLIDGAGGRDRLTGGEGEDMYMVKDRHDSVVVIDNYSTDNLTDLAIIKANLHSFQVQVQSENVILNISNDQTRFMVILVNWFRSPADRHLFIVTKDLITFTVSDNKADCLHRESLFTKCIRSQSIDYSKSTSPLMVDLQEDQALESLTEVRGSNFSDVIRGNKGHNVFIPGGGDDFIQGRGGEDWYVITPGQGVKTINNQSPDQVVDLLFLRGPYQQITSMCERQNIIIFVNGRRNIILENWFVSKNYQHLQIKTSDGITAGLMSSPNSCTEHLIFPITVDYRNQEPEPLSQPSINNGLLGCYVYRNKNSDERRLCGLRGKVMEMSEADTVKEMYGSSGFDIMVGNSKDNLLDPYTEGALMFGGEGKDTYIIKPGYGNNTIIDNFAEDLNTDTLLVDMDFIDGGKVTLDSPSTADVEVTITSKGEQFKLSLLNYKRSYQHQHLEFQSSDGVLFKLNSLNSTGNAPFFQIEAFKVILKQPQVDCRMDLSSQRNLSKVHTVQGCQSQSNNILGNDQDNALIGGEKDDALEGGEGADTLIGGSGADILIGGMGDDTLYGEDGNDTMMGNSGSDVFIPGPGADLVDGGPGRDTVLYRGDHDKGKGVYVNLLTGQGRYADAEGDVLKDVETVIGTIYSDILVSGYESSLLQGSDGNDVLVSTGGDYLVGGDGHDIYMLAFHNNSVTIDNCAKDNATDVLYFISQAAPIFDCQHRPDAVLLTFFGPRQSTVNIVVRGWTGDAHECGHLKVVFRGKQVSVDGLLQMCELSGEEGFWSSVIGWVTITLIVTVTLIVISLVLFHFVVISQQGRKSRRRTPQQKDTGFTAEVDLTVVGADVGSEISPCLSNQAIDLSMSS